LEFSGSSVPQDPHDSPVAVSAPRRSSVPSTSVSFHPCSGMSFISLCHVRALVALASVCGFGTGISTMGLP
jgi:hypothetical protein